MCISTQFPSDAHAGWWAEGHILKTTGYTLYVENDILQCSYTHDTKYTGRGLVLIKSQTYTLAS